MVSSEISEIPIECEIELLVEFVNTLNVEDGRDSIGEPVALERWIGEHGEGVPTGAVDAEGHRRVLALRESLRAMLGANNNGEAGEEEVLVLRAAAERSRYEATLDADGRLCIDPAGIGPEALEARLLLAVERIQALGAWPRLKACACSECQWAFYDTSRNRSRTWCSMDECGNREKTRRYRRRKATP
jgi:predicted RNA-binding Zn ribbon-like protein